MWKSHSICNSTYMEFNLRKEKFVRVIVTASLIYCVLMLLTIVWTWYGPIPGTRFEAIVETNSRGTLSLRHNRYFLSPDFVKAGLAIPVRNLPPSLGQSGVQVECPYRVLERDRYQATVLDGADCTAIEPRDTATTKIEAVRTLPMVQEFIKDVEEAKNGRRVSFRIEEAELVKDEVVVVSETDDTKETVWRRFLVQGQTITVENPLTGEFEPIAD